MANERILILEDHPDLREQTRLTLNDAGYATRATATGAEAVDAAQAESFDLMIADIFVPDGSGIEFFQQIRARQPEIAGIVFTGHSTWELAANALNAGFNGFLVKPAMPEQLLAAIVNALEQEKLRRENARLHALVPLYELSHTFMGAVPLAELLHQIVAAAQRQTQAQVVSLMLLEPDGQTLALAATAGLGRLLEGEKLELGKGIAGRVAQRGEPIIVAENVPLADDIRQAMNQPDVLSAMSLPLRVRGVLIGVLNLSRMRDGKPFQSSDLEIATVFAGQAAMAIDQARLFDQLKALNQIEQQLASAADLGEALHVLLAAPRQLVHACETSLVLIESAIETRTLNPRALGKQLRVLPSEKIIGEVQANRLADWLCLPLQHGEKTIGVLKIHLPSFKPPSEEALATLHTLTHTASAVIESHSLRARELNAFREMDRAMRGEANMQDLHNRLLTEMIAACQADSGGMFLWDDGEPIETWASVNFAGGKDLARTILATGRAQLLASDATRTLIGAPMIIGNRTHGAVILARALAVGNFSQRQVDLLATLTSATALLIRNAQLYARSEESTVVEERTRIAREIHDGLAQDLSYLVLKIGAAQKLATQNKERELRKELTDISDQLRRDIRDLRRTIFALRPLDIETEGFLPALMKFVKEFGQANDIDAQLDIHGDAMHLAPKLEIALFRLTQESLNNVRKHAQAKHVQIDLTLDPGHAAALRIHDDGVGFEVEQTLPAARRRGSVGLVQMRERAERAGGHFEIETAPGQGTTIHVELPIHKM